MMWRPAAILLLALAAACDRDAPAAPPVLAGCGIASGDRQGLDSGAVAAPLVIRCADSAGAPVSGVPVRWAVTRGGGLLAADSTVTDASGMTSVSFTPGTGGFGQGVSASPAAMPTLAFSLTLRRRMAVLGGGNNVTTSHYTSDLWVANGYAYSGTWGTNGNIVNVWQLGGGGAPTLVDSVAVSPDIGTVSDLQVDSTGAILAVTGEYETSPGLYLYSLADPAHPAPLASLVVSSFSTTGLHTGTLAEIGGVLYDFTAQDPPHPALIVFRIQPESTTKIVPVDSIAMPANYGIHDTYVRDGLLFVCNWNSGLWIYDIGGGGRGGSVTAPVLISSIVTAAAADGSTPAGQVHNAWWFHNGATGDKKYVFVGQEGPDVIGAQSNGDIHVVDISDIDHPAEVAHYHMGAQEGTHNFWMDEQRQILYAAYYNGGVVALDVSGTLSGDLASREIARIAPGGPGHTYVWGVMLYGGHLYAADMLSGLWELSIP